MLRYPNVLLLSTDQKETAVLERTLSEHVILTAIDNLQEADWLLETGDYDALFCAASFAQGRNDALEDLRESYPDLPIIALPSKPESREWMQLSKPGAFDALMQPYEPATVLPVLEPKPSAHAWTRTRTARAKMWA